MGAAASIKQVYHDGLLWFREYIDTETYMGDFKQLDKHSDGSIEYGVLHQWFQEKLDKEGGNWKLFLSNTPILSIAHKMASKSLDKSSSVISRNVVDIQEFRFFLIHLFAISILWSHFSNAENWSSGVNDIGKNHLNKESFYVAYLTMTSTHAGEKLTRSQIDQDFELLDKNNKGTIGFLDVCNYCSQFVTATLSDTPNNKVDSPVPKKFFGQINGPIVEMFRDLNTGPKQYYESHTVEEKTARAIDAIAFKMENQLKHAMNEIGVDKLLSQLDEADKKAELEKLVPEDIVEKNILESTKLSEISITGLSVSQKVVGENLSTVQASDTENSQTLPIQKNDEVLTYSEKFSPTLPKSAILIEDTSDDVPFNSISNGFKNSSDKTHSIMSSQIDSMSPNNIAVSANESVDKFDETPTKIIEPNKSAPDSKPKRGFFGFSKGKSSNSSGNDKDKERSSSRISGDKEKTSTRISGDKEKTSTRVGGDKEKTSTRISGDKEKTSVRKGSDNKERSVRKGSDRDREERSSIRISARIAPSNGSNK